MTEEMRPSTPAEMPVPPDSVSADSTLAGQPAPVHQLTPTQPTGASPDGPRPSFSRAVWRIAAAEVSAGNKVKLLRDGPQTFEAMLLLIDEAKETIEFEGYIYHDDEVGCRFADAFRAAAARGVKVRMLVDWIGRLPTRASFFHAIAAAGVALRFFNPIGWRSWLGILPRDHRKLLVADDRIGVTGGLGIGKEWGYGWVRRKRRRLGPWRDTGVRIEGPAALDMRESFDRMWARALGRTPEWRRLRTPRRGRVQDSHLNARFDPPSLVGIIEGEPGRLRVSRVLQLQAVAAQRSIWIASAYFVPSFAEMEALGGAARDGVDVRVLVPSKYDHPWLRRLTMLSYARLLKSGVRLWEWRGDMMHAKTTVVDGRWLRVGSTDLNPLAVAINYELDAIVEDRALGAEAEAMFLEDLALSQEILRPGAK